MLGATDCSFFTGPQGEHFTVATSIVGSRTFPSWLRAMRRADLMDDPRFASAAARRLNFGALHQIIQSWILTFPDMATLDAQFDEAKIAMGEIRSIKELTVSEWSEYWGAVQQVTDRSGGQYRLPGRPWRFSAEELTPIVPPALTGMPIWSSIFSMTPSRKQATSDRSIQSIRASSARSIAWMPESAPPV